MKNPELIKLIGQRIDNLSQEHNNLLAKRTAHEDLLEQLNNTVHSSAGAIMELRSMKEILEKEEEKVNKEKEELNEKT